MQMRGATGRGIRLATGEGQQVARPSLTEPRYDALQFQEENAFTFGLAVGKHFLRSAQPVRIRL